MEVPFFFGRFQVELPKDQVRTIAFGGGVRAPKPLCHPGRESEIGDSCASQPFQALDRFTSFLFTLISPQSLSDTSQTRPADQSSPGSLSLTKSFRPVSAPHPTKPAMAPTRRHPHTWTAFEQHTLLCLLCRQIQLTGTTSPPGSAKEDVPKLSSPSRTP